MTCNQAKTTTNKCESARQSTKAPTMITSFLNPAGHTSATRRAMTSLCRLVVVSMPRWWSSRRAQSNPEHQHDRFVPIMFISGSKLPWDSRHYSSLRCDWGGELNSSHHHKDVAGVIRGVPTTKGMIYVTASLSVHTYIYIYVYVYINTSITTVSISISISMFAVNISKYVHVEKSVVI